MKVFIIGHKGWIGQMYIKLFEQQNIEYIYSKYRGETNEIKKDILNSNVTHVLCTMGRTHGYRDGIKYTTIDYLQDNSVLKENVNDNLFVPVSLALFCDKHNIHFTYMGTGCIYNYDNDHEQYGGSLGGFTETDKPNFFGSNYSIVKGFTNELMKQTNALTLRIRMPITSCNSPRNFITKITTYEKICSISNSMSVLDELLPLSIKMMENKDTGLYNFTNPNNISHNEILDMYKEIVDPNFTWQNFTLEEQALVLNSERSNNLLDTSKLTNKYNVDDIHTAVRKVLMKMTNNDS
jgi:nucleoside-diphosphate-sugar epimerase